MTLKEVKKVIKEQLGNFLKKYGYKFDSKAESYLRYFDGGYNSVSTTIVDYRIKCKISFYFSIRFNAVEKIVQKHFFVLEDYREYTWTLHTSIDHFTGFKEYAINSEEPLLDLLNEINEVYASKIDDFFKQYSNIERVDEALNVQHANIGFMSTADDYIRPIVIAKLVGNKDFEKVADWYYKKYVEDYYLDAEEGPNKIKDVIDYLKTL